MVKNPSSCQHCCQNHGFTLVEMLVVVVVIVILLLVGAPMLSDSSVNARQTSREIVRAHLQQARGQAIASGRATAVIIAGDIGGVTKSSGLITLAEVEPLPAGAVPFKVSRLIMRWTALPESMFFLAKSVTNSTKDTLLDGPAIVEATYQNIPVLCHAVIFSPDGRVTHPADGVGLAIAIGRGKVSGSGVVATQKSGNKVTFDFLGINRLNARARLIDPHAAP
jgi:prepilin-type N-terminal cleavage/methylation domain-containing protein